MEKIVLHVNDNKVEFIKELLSHFYFVKIAGTEKLKEPHDYQGVNFYAASVASHHDSGSITDDKEENTGMAIIGNDQEMSEMEVRNLKQLRDALDMIDSIRDKNKQ